MGTDARRYADLVVSLASIAERALTGNELADSAVAGREDELRARAIPLAAVVNGADADEAESYLDADIEDELAKRRFDREMQDDTPALDTFCHDYEMAV